MSFANKQEGCSKQSTKFISMWKYCNKLEVMYDF